ncbi:hypothetical protein DVH05_023457 [Phytophthora capsici]|nr:hypothetical protein DVH05_023457 [Phytophthora capsici]
MRKVGKTFNFGVKGTIHVRLDRESYAAGDLVQGQLILRIKRPMKRKDFSLHVEGVETIAWAEGANHALSNCNMNDEFLCERIRLMDPMPNTFDTGEYRFRFRYLLGDTLPPVLRVTGGFAGTMRERFTPLKLDWVCRASWWLTWRPHMTCSCIVRHCATLCVRCRDHRPTRCDC